MSYSQRFAQALTATLALSGCDMVSNVQDEIPPEKVGIISCTSKLLNSSVSFHTASVALVEGVSGIKIRATSLETGQTIDFKENEDWICTSADGEVTPMFVRGNQEPT